MALLQQGKLVEAETLCRTLVARQPENFDAWYLLAGLCFQQRRWADALAAIEAALARKDDAADAHNLKGAALRALGRREEAAHSIAAAAALAPDNAILWLNLSSVQGDLCRSEDALQSADRAIALAPGNAESWNNRGAALRALGQREEALESCSRALTFRPGYIPAMRNVAALLCETFHVGEGMAVYAEQAQIIRGGPEEGAELAHKRQHDAEQRAFLAQRNIAADFHVEPGERVAHAVNPANAGMVEQAWRTKTPQIVVVDDLLTPEALEGLRRFCLGSTVWRKAYGEGYLGATPETGFACPLLAQIAEELRDVFPAVFEAHPLRYLWGFKYDSALSGIDVHADFAAVNVNFWITPDEANTDPQSGGLVLWDVAAPRDWDVVKYNRDAGAARGFLDEKGARPITVPYRANRAVIFDSDLFHRTDRIAFKDGYLNRRINVTMLYGDR